jgi:exopolysaccharide biosynthesis polyprenyl glycosylphosphotransferase
MATDITRAHARVGTSADWRQIYSRRLVYSDLAVVIWVVVAAELLVFDSLGMGSTVQGLEQPFVIPASAMSALLIAGWMFELTLNGTRDYRIIGIGAEEYKRIGSSTLRLFGIVAIAALLFKVDIARSYLLLAFPLGLLALLVTRRLWRRWLLAQRQHGEFSARVLLVGTPAGVGQVSDDLRTGTANGYVVVGAWVAGPPMRVARTAGQIPWYSSEELSVLAAMNEVDADTVAIVNASALGRNGVSELSWQLEPGRHHLLLAPDLTDVGGPRLNTRPAEGLPLIHLETPSYQGANRLTKRAFDVVTASLIVVLTSPVLVVLALLVRASGAGPILFRQERVGINGTSFTMLKFRSMVFDAEQRLSELTETRTAGNQVMFKMKDDPRITPVGRFMRRYSLDELPQLLNVIVGSMSLVGPRPPLPREVELYESHVHRRFLVKPGITGLWQVSGRSNLTWEQSVRLDLTYVQHWSLVGDLLILWRTFKAVIARDGAF